MKLKQGKYNVQLVHDNVRIAIPGFAKPLTFENARNLAARNGCKVYTKICLEPGLVIQPAMQMSGDVARSFLTGLAAQV